jgi:hypothetical protein
LAVVAVQWQGIGSRAAVVSAARRWWQQGGSSAVAAAAAAAHQWLPAWQRWWQFGGIAASASKIQPPSWPLTRSLLEDTHGMFDLFLMCGTFLWHVGKPTLQCCNMF